MLDYSFLEILESLTREELKSFKRFILSPYFNRSNKVVKLYDALIKYHPSFQNTNLTKEKLHQRISPDLPYNEITMRRLLFDLQKLTERYIQQINLEKNEIDSKLSMIEELAMRGASKMHRKSIKETGALLDSDIIADSDYCIRKFRLETEQFYYSLMTDKITKKSFVDTEAKKLIDGITYLISYFMLETIKHNYTLLNYSRSFNIKINEKFINQFIGLFDLERLEIFIRKNSIAGGNTIEVYLNILKAFLYFDNEYYFEELKNSLRKHSDKLSLIDNHFTCARLTDYCILKNSNSATFNSYFENELFDVYKTILKNKFYETEANQYVPVDLFRNILIQSIRMKELQWMEEFIADYGRLLHPDRRKDIINYGYALLYFERGVYDESLKWLSAINSEEFSFHLDLRSLYFRIYFEQGQLETALSTANAAKKFLKENPLVSAEKKIWNENFFRNAIKLINYHNTKTKTDLTALRLSIQKTKKVSGKDWLLDKVDFLDRSVKRARAI